MSTTSFQEAYEDYRYLRERSYPEVAALKVVADRYRLTRIERNCLFRGVIPSARCMLRKAKLVSAGDVHAMPLGVDWYNALITVESYLKGSVLFLADDGVLRDSSAIHGSYRPGKTTATAIDSILSSMVPLGPARIDFFLDSPIAFSGAMADMLREELDGLVYLVYSVTVLHSADFPLKNYQGIVASSDSIILDSASEIFDLSRHVLSHRYGFTPRVLPDLAFPAPAPPAG